MLSANPGYSPGRLRFERQPGRAKVRQVGLGKPLWVLRPQRLSANPGYLPGQLHLVEGLSGVYWGQRFLRRKKMILTIRTGLWMAQAQAPRGQTQAQSATGTPEASVRLRGISTNPVYQLQAAQPCRGAAHPAVVGQAECQIRYFATGGARHLVRSEYPLK